MPSRCASTVADSCHVPFALCFSYEMQGSECASEPTQFNGKLDSDKGLNIMSSTECANKASCGCVQEHIYP